MSSRKYVPNRLRGVLGGDDGSGSPSPSPISSSLRLKGRKSRPWRVDAASWKQQLQERKAVYDHFALPEKVDEEQKEPSKEMGPPQVKRAISLPSHIMASDEFDQSQNVETMVTPKRGEHVEMVLKQTSTTTTPLSSLLSSTAKHHVSDDSGSDADSCETNADQRKSSPLPRHRNSLPDNVPSPGKSRRGKKLSTRTLDSIDLIDFSNLTTSRSKDSSIGIINGVPTGENRVFTPKSKVQLLRHGDNDDTAERTGFIVDRDGNSSLLGEAVNKLTVMDAVEDFIDPSQKMKASGTKNNLPLRKSKSNSRLVAAAEEKIITRTRPQAITAMYENEIYVYENEGITASRSPIIVRNAGESSSVQNSPCRRGGRRRPRPATTMPQLSPATSATSTDGTIMRKCMDDSSRSKSNSTNSSETQDGVRNKDGSDDEWSIRPVPSDEDECLERRRWPVRKDADGDATTSSDAGIITVMTDLVFVSSSASDSGNEQEILCNPQHHNTEDDMGSDESETSREIIRLRKQISSSLSFQRQKDGSNTAGSSSEMKHTPNYKANDSEKLIPATPRTVSPDPLQRARKTLLLSNFNRSMRSLQDSPLHSRRRNERAMDESSVENSSTRTIFVPLRSRQPRRRNVTQDDNGRDIPLNVLNDHGVYVSQYNENGIYVPPNTHPMQPSTETSQIDPTKEVYNKLGAFVPSSTLLQEGNILHDDNIREKKKYDNPDANDNSHDMIPTPSLETAKSDVMEEKLKGSTARDIVEKNVNEDSMEDPNGVDGVPTVNTKVTVSFTINGGTDYVCNGDVQSVNKEEQCSDTLQEELQSGADVASIVAASLAEDVQLDTELAPMDQNSKTAQRSIDISSTEFEEDDESDSEENVGNDAGNGSAVDKMDAIKEQLMTDLKQRIRLLYTENHMCIETVGTSNNLDPLTSVRKVKASKRNSLRETKESVQLKAQLNDIISSMNTDHHHVIESPGKLKSAKGKKWKERMALKKAAKKNSSQATQSHANTGDEEMDHCLNRATTDLPPQESMDDSPTRCKNDQEEGMKPVDNRIQDTPIAEKAKQDTVEQSYSNHDSKDDGGTQLGKAIVKQQGETIGSIGSSQSGTSVAEKFNEDTMDKVPKEPKDAVVVEDVSMINGIEEPTHVQKHLNETLVSQNDMKKDSDLQDNGIGSDMADEAIAQDEKEDKSPMETDSDIVPSRQGKAEGPTTDSMVGDDDANIFTTEDEERNGVHSSADNDNNQTIIQGLPPSKGKKWKDRLKKMKNKRSSKLPAAKKDTEDTQQPLLVSPSNSLGLCPTHSESSSRPTFNRVLSDLTAPPEEEPRPEFKNTEPVESSSTEKEADNIPLSLLPSSSNSVGGCSAHSENSSRCATFDEGIPGLTARAEAKICAVPPLIEEHAETSSKNGGKKSNKWKNRLAKKKITKQESTRTFQRDAKAKAVVETPQIIEPLDIHVPETLKLNPEPCKCGKDQDAIEETAGSSLVDKTGVSGSGLGGESIGNPVTQSGTITSQVEAEKQDKGIQRDLRESFTTFDKLLREGPIGESSRDQCMDEETNSSIGVKKSEVSDPEYGNETVDDAPPQAEAISSMIESNKHDPGIQRDLRQSFTVFDAFLKGGPAGANPIDDESIYTELTIGEETMLENATHNHENPYQEEEQSYMDFTMEESVQPSYVDQTIVSSIASKDRKISPFMSNLLSSRMFQDGVVPPIPLKSIQGQKEQPQFQKVGESERPDKNTKQFPTITVGAYDDDMTQITMGSLEGDDIDIDARIDVNQDDFEDEFFDAETIPLSIAPSSKSFGKKSSVSKNSRKSESATSIGSQVSCSESSKQRIAEILRREVWSRDVDVVKRAVEELEMEATKGYSFRAQIVRCGGVMTIMKAMETNPSYASMLVPCCSTLEKLALEPQTQVAVCEMEGISLIVRSMQDHADNAELQESACAALATICRQQEANTEQDPMKDAEGAVPTLLSCMTRFPTNSIIQAKAFAAISNLCTGNHSQERLAELSKAGGIITLTMALQTPWESKNEKQEAISNLPILLRGLTDLNEKNLPFPSADEISKDTKLDASSRTSNETESMSTMKDDNEKTKQNGSTTRTSSIGTRQKKSAGGVVSTESQDSCSIEEIPELPIMESSSSNHIEEIPDLDEMPTMMSNIEWQNFDKNNPDSPLKKSTHGMPPDKTDSSNNGNEEQCAIQ
eukprot:jgi/Psemu1/282023/fgenesh1_pg.2_\